MYTDKYKNVLWRSFCVSLVIGLSFPFGILGPAQAAVPRVVNYQSRLRDAALNPITASTNIQYTLYNHASNGSFGDAESSSGPVLWKEVHDGVSCPAITPDADGYFAVQLGACVAFPSYIDFNSPLYLGVRIGTDAEASPRVLFAAHPYSLNAETVDTLHATSTATANQLLALDNDLNFDISTGTFYGGGLLVNGSSTLQNLNFTVATGTSLELNSYLSIGAIRLDAVGTSNVSSGAYLVGVFDEFANSNATTVQGALRDFDLGLSAVSSSLSNFDLQAVTDNGNTTTNAIQFAGGTSTGDINPSISHGLSLGSSSTRWSGVWADSVYVGTSTWNLAQSAAGNFTVSDIGGSSRMSIDRNGRIIVGQIDGRGLNDTLNVFGGMTLQRDAIIRLDSNDGNADGWNAGVVINSDENNGGEAGYIDFQTNSTHHSQIYGSNGSDGLSLQTHAALPITLFTATTERMRLTADGRIGLLTNDPNAFAIQAAGHFGPDSDATFDLGSATMTWRNIYAGLVTTTELYVNGQRVTGGSTTLDTAYDGGGSGLGRFITADAGPITITGLTYTQGALNITNATDSQAVYVNNTGVGNAFSARNMSTGAGFYSRNQGAGPGVRVDNNTASGLGLWVDNPDAGTAIQVDNYTTGLGLLVNNSGAGFGQRILNTGSGIGLNIQTSSSTGLGLYVRQNDGYGIRLDNNTANEGLRVNNNGTGKGIYVENSSDDRGFYMYDTGGKTGFQIDKPLNGGNAVELSVADGARSFYVTQAGTGEGFWMRNTGSGASLWIEDAGSDVSPFVLDSDGRLAVSATNTANFMLTVGGDVGPGSHNAYDLGSATTSWRNLYAQGFVSTTALYVNGQLIPTSTGSLQAAYNAGRTINTVDGSTPVEIVNPGTDQWETALSLRNGANGGGIALQTMEAFGDYGGRIFLTDDVTDPTNGTGAFMYTDNTMQAFEFGYQTSGARNSSFYIDASQMALDVPGTQSNGALRILARNYVPVLTLAGPGNQNFVQFSVGTSTPEGRVEGNSGSVFQRTDGAGGSQQMYVKLTDGGTSGWVPVLTASSTVAEADTLQTVTNRGSSTTNTIQFAGGTSTGDLTVSGNLGIGTNATSAFALSLYGGPSYGDRLNVGNGLFAWNGLADTNHFVANMDDGSVSLSGGILEMGDTQNAWFGTKVSINGTGGYASIMNGDFGIGTNAPSSLLHLQGGANGDAILTIDSDDGAAIGRDAGIVINSDNVNGSDAAFIKLSNNGVQSTKIFGSPTESGVEVAGNNPFQIWTNSWLRLTVGGNGFVGIGTSTPQNILGVAGAISVASSTPATSTYALYNLGGTLYWNGLPISSASTLVDSDGDTRVAVEASPDEDFIRFSTSGTERMFIDNNGRIGINVNNPLVAGLQIGQGGHMNAALSINGSPGYTGIAAFRDEDGEDIFTAMGSLANNDFVFMLGDVGGAYPNSYNGSTGIRISQADEAVIFGREQIRFLDGGGGEYVGFLAPASVTTNTIWTLPSQDGSAGQVLTTNGSGILSWGSAASSATGTFWSLNGNSNATSGSILASSANLPLTIGSQDIYGSYTSINSGNGAPGTNDAGNPIGINAGIGDGSGRGGDIGVYAGEGGATTGGGGNLTLSAGSASNDGNGGNGYLYGGGGSLSGRGGSLVVQAGAAGSIGPRGGDVTIRGGDADNGDGGYVNIIPGFNAGGNDGRIVLGYDMDAARRVGQTYVGTSTFNGFSGALVVDSNTGAAIDLVTSDDTGGITIGSDRWGGEFGLSYNRSNRLMVGTRIGGGSQYDYVDLADRTVTINSLGSGGSNPAYFGINNTDPQYALDVNSGFSWRPIAFFNNINTGFHLFSTTGTPEGAVVGEQGDLAVDPTNGRLFIKQSGIGTNTGWVAVATGTSSGSALTLQQVTDNGNTTTRAIQFAGGTSTSDFILSRPTAAANLTVNSGNDDAFFTMSGNGGASTLRMSSNAGGNWATIETASNGSFNLVADGKGVAWADGPTGFLGVGTNSPQSLLNVHSDTQISELRVSSAGGQNAYVVVDFDKAGGGEGSLSFRENGVQKGVINSGTGSYDFFGVAADGGAALDFFTNGLVRLHVATGTGAVGIGSTDPTARLHVASGAASTTAVMTVQSNAGDFQIFDVAASPEGAVTASRGDLAVDSSNGRMYIKETGSGTNTGWSTFATGTVVQHWQKNTNVLSPADSAVYQIAVANNSASTLTGFKAVNTNDASNYAGAVIEMKGSGADFTNNMYFGKYGAGFWIPSWAGNGVLATDKNLVVSAVGNTSTIAFQVGGGYSAPVSRMTLDSDSLDVLQGLKVDFVTTGVSAQTASMQQVIGGNFEGVQLSVPNSAAGHAPFVGFNLGAASRGFLFGSYSNNGVMRINDYNFANLQNNVSHLDISQTMNTGVFISATATNPSIHLSHLYGSNSGVKLYTRDSSDDNGYSQDLVLSLSQIGAGSFTDRYKFTYDGRLGVNTMSPANALHVNGGISISSSTPMTTSTALYNLGNTLYWNGWQVATGTGAGSPAGTDGQLQFNDGGAFGATSTLYWDKANGRLGVGTSTPAYALTVVGTSSLLRTYNPLTGSGLTLNQNGAVATTRFVDSDLGVNFNILRYRGTDASPIPLIDGDVIGNLNFGPYNGTNVGVRASISAVINGTTTGTMMPTDLIFFTGTSSEVEKMRILSSGNVGLGTSTPAFLLDVAGDARISAQLMLGRYASLPVSGAQAGALVYNSASSSVHFWDGSQWVMFATGTGSGSLTLQQVTDYGNTTTNAIQFAGGTSTGNFLPSVTNSLALGSTANRWSDVWTANLHLGTSTWDLGQSADGGLVFNTSASEKARLTPAGNLGIGEMAPTRRLEIVGSSTAADDLFKVSGGSNNGYLSVYMEPTDDRNSKVEFMRELAFVSTGFGSSMLRLTDDAVGVNTDTPTQALSVAGDAVIGQYDSGILPIGGTDHSLYVNAVDGQLAGTQGTASLVMTRNTALLGRLNLSTQNNLLLQNYVGGAWNTGLMVSPNGNVGVGALTSAPDSKLAVFATGTNDATFRLFNDDTANFKISAANGLTTVNFDEIGDGNELQFASELSGVMRLTRNRVGIGNTSPSTTFHVVGTSTLQNVVPQTGLSYDFGSAASRWNNAWISSLHLGTSTWDLSQASNGALTIGQYLGTEAMRIATNGNVGIGTNNPSNALHVVGSARATSGFSANAGTAGSPAYYYTSDSDTGVFNPAANSLALTTGGTERLRINSSGNVGIGTSAPGSKLEISADNSLANASLLKFQASNNSDIQSEIYFSGGGNATYWNVDSSGAGGALIVMNGSTEIGKFVNNGVVINEGGAANVDFRVESDTSTHAFFVDATNGNSGFDQSAPLARLHVGNATAGATANYDFMRLQATGDVDHSLYLPVGSNLMVWDYNTTGNGGAIEFRNNGSRVGMFTNTGLVVNEGGVTGVGLRVEGDTNANLLYTDATNDRIGVGTSTPAVRLHVTQSGNTVAAFDRSTNDGTVISIRQDGVEEGTISVSGNTVSYNAFTGSHYAWTPSAIEKGMLVSLTGVNRRLHDNPSSEILYGVEKTVQANDDRVMGAYLSLLNSADAPSSDNPHLVMAVGNGEVWVVEGASDLKAGDYLVSSDVAGHAVLDSRSTDKSYVVARAAEDVKWSEVMDTADGRKHKLVSVFFESFTRDNSTGALLQGQQAGEQLPASSAVVIKDDYEFQGKVVIQGQVTFGGDSVGQAKILSGQKEVRVIFDKEYATQPIVTVTPLDFLDTMYRVADVNTKGFVIQLNGAQGNDKLFNWHAFGSAGGKVSVSDGTTSTVQLIVIDDFLPIGSALVATSTAETPLLDGSSVGAASGTASGAAAEPTAEALPQSEETPLQTTEPASNEPVVQADESGTPSGSGSTSEPEQASAPAPAVPESAETAPIEVGIVTP